MSTNATSSPEVLVVGSGPTGLISALTLAKNGIPVRVIEKTKTYRIGQRGSGIMPRSLETLKFLGVVDQVLARATYMLPFCMYKLPEGVEVIKEFTGAPILNPTPARPYLNARLLGQDNLDKILRAELQKCGVEVEIGAELQAIEQHKDHVDVKILKHDLLNSSASPILEESSFKWLIGADGARGVVRKQLGLSFLGETTTQSAMIGDIMVEGLDQKKWHLWGDFGKTMTSLRATETPGLFNFFITVKDVEQLKKLGTTENDIKKLLSETTGKREDIKWGKVICAGPYTINIRMVDRFKMGRCFIAGDAGHIHSPTGGQGMNSGIQDSFNLGWKLALVLKGLAPESLLDTYNEERLPVIAEMLNMTSTILKKTFENKSIEDAMNRTGDLDQLGVNYRFSSIVVDEESERLGIDRASGSAYHIDAHEAPRAGDRAPDAPNLAKAGHTADNLRLFNLLSPTRHTLLIFASRVGYRSILSAISSYSPELVLPVVIFPRGKAVEAIASIAVEDRQDHAHDAYKGPEGTSSIFVIRPDGVIGARVGSVEFLLRYFQSIFIKA
ncbi:hypothetical protein CPC08DRAFT_761319 [Agrocybe pediades]|nr:hypothetical protein CPC08DRAFT_761319 [Agrocybe pediades]